MFVLIVKDEQETITKCTNEIKTCLKSVRPNVTVQHRSLSDRSDERFRIKCDKVLFLLSNKDASLDIAKKEWICNLPKINNDETKFKIVRLGANYKKSNFNTVKALKRKAKENAKEESEVDVEEEYNIEEILQENSERDSNDNIAGPSNRRTEAEIEELVEELSNDNTRRTNINNNNINPREDGVIGVPSFEKAVFKWWPSVLEFLFGRQSIGRWLNTNFVPSKHCYCLHYLPDRNQIVHPITRHVLDMLQTFGAHKVDHHDDKQCCILLCKDAGMSLPLAHRSELTRQTANTQVFAIALSGTNFSDELATCTDRHFTKANLMTFILVLLTELNLINCKTRHQPAGRPSSNLRLPSLLKYFIAHLVFIFNLPALFIQLAVAMVCPWPILTNCLVQDSDKRAYYVNIGLAVCSIVSIITVIVTEMVLYPDFSPFPIYVVTAIYLLIWQIGVGSQLYLVHGYKYGIFSIPSRILKNA